ncbi:hypothetical protein GGS20DRAFT_584868 [Poronia punctata]|nr:hypothetical protein GGS20DRAFT_584868 [Poronia punctata]
MLQRCRITGTSADPKNSYHRSPVRNHRYSGTPPLSECEWESSDSVQKRSGPHNLSRLGYDEEKCRNVLVRLCAHIPRNFQYRDGIPQVFLILREHLGDENLDLAGGVLYELIEVDCEYTDDPGAAFQRWRHDHMHRYADLELPHIPHMMTITSTIIPTETLSQWRSEHADRYRFVLADSSPLLGRSSGDIRCVRNRKAWLIDHTLFVSTRSEGTWPIRSPSPRQFHELQWDPGYGPTGRHVEEREVPMASLDRVSEPSLPAITDTFLGASSRRQRLRRTLSSLSILEKVGEKMEKYKNESQAERWRGSCMSTTLGFGSRLASREKRTQPLVDKVPLPENCQIPNAIFARKFQIVKDDGALPPDLAISQMPTAESKATETIVEAASSGLLSQDSTWLSRGPFTPQLGFDGGLDFQWSTERTSINIKRFDQRTSTPTTPRLDIENSTGDSTFLEGTSSHTRENQALSKRRGKVFQLEVPEDLGSSIYTSIYATSDGTSNFMTEESSAHNHVFIYEPYPTAQESQSLEQNRMASQPAVRDRQDEQRDYTRLFENIEFTFQKEQHDPNNPSINRQTTIIERPCQGETVFGHDCAEAEKPRTPGSLGQLSVLGYSRLQIQKVYGEGLMGDSEAYQGTASVQHTKCRRHTARYSQLASSVAWGHWGDTAAVEVQCQLWEKREQQEEVWLQHHLNWAHINRGRTFSAPSRPVVTHRLNHGYVERYFDSFSTTVVTLPTRNCPPPLGAPRPPRGRRYYRRGADGSYAAALYPYSSYSEPGFVGLGIPSCHPRVIDLDENPHLDPDLDLDPDQLVMTGNNNPSSYPTPPTSRPSDSSSAASSAVPFPFSSRGQSSIRLVKPDFALPTTQELGEEDNSKERSGDTAVDREQQNEATEMAPTPYPGLNGPNFLGGSQFKGKANEQPIDSATHIGHQRLRSLDKLEGRDEYDGRGVGPSVSRRVEAVASGSSWETLTPRVPIVGRGRPIHNRYEFIDSDDEMETKSHRTVQDTMAGMSNAAKGKGKANEPGSAMTTVTEMKQRFDTSHPSFHPVLQQQRYRERRASVAVDSPATHDFQSRSKEKHRPPPLNLETPAFIGMVNRHNSRYEVEHNPIKSSRAEVRWTYSPSPDGPSSVYDDGWRYTVSPPDQEINARSVDFLTEYSKWRENLPPDSSSPINVGGPPPPTRGDMNMARPRDNEGYASAINNPVPRPLHLMRSRSTLGIRETRDDELDVHPLLRNQVAGTGTVGQAISRDNRRESAGAILSPGMGRSATIHHAPRHHREVEAHVEKMTARQGDGIPRSSTVGEVPPRRSSLRLAEPTSPYEHTPLTPFIMRATGAPSNVQGGNKTLFGEKGWLEDTAGSSYKKPKADKMGGFMDNIIRKARVLADNRSFITARQTRSISANHLTISLDPREQSLMYGELEFNLNNALDSYIKVQLNAGRLNPGKLSRVSDAWAQKGRPKVVGFRYDLETQIELVMSHVEEFRFYGPRPIEGEASVLGLLQAMKSNARYLRVRTYCHPDTVIAKQILDSQNLLRLLDSPEPFQRAVEEVAQFFKVSVDRRKVIDQTPPPRDARRQVQYAAGYVGGGRIASNGSEQRVRFQDEDFHHHATTYESNNDEEPHEETRKASSGSTRQLLAKLKSNYDARVAREESPQNGFRLPSSQSHGAAQGRTGYYQ